MSRLDALNIAVRRYLQRTTYTTILSDEFRREYRGITFSGFKPDQASNMLVGRLLATPYNPADPALYIHVCLSHEDLLTEPLRVYDLVDLRIREALHRMNAMVEDPFTAWVREVRQENGLE